MKKSYIKHKKNSIRIISSYCFISLMLISCISTVEKIDPSRLIIRTQDQQIVNKSEYAEIIYKSDIMDTIQLSQKDLRTVAFHFGIFKRAYEIQELEGKTTESFGLIKDSVIPFEIQIDKIGDFILDGYIEETVYLDNYYKNGKSRMLTNQIKVSKKIKIVGK